MPSRSFIVLDPHNLLSLKPHPDNFVVNETSGYGINKVRELIDWVYKRPFNRGYKLVWIEEGHKLSRQAQNALLKVLEEPPERSNIYIAVPTKERLLATIQSRCQVVNKEDLEGGDLLDSQRLRDNLWKRAEVAELPEFPKVSSASQAFEMAEELAKKEREELVELLESWAVELTRENAQETYSIVDNLLETIEYLEHNTNVQLSLEVMFLKNIPYSR